VRGANAILTAVGYNFRLVLAWLRELLRLLLIALLRTFLVQSNGQISLLTADEIMRLGWQTARQRCGQCCHLP